MSPGRQDERLARSSAVVARPGGGHDASDREHVLAPAEDRWRWRGRVRSSPHQLRVYRVLVGIVGLFLVCLGCVTGPLPGPGGIPLVLLGLAVWASEFGWAHRLMMWLKHLLHVFGSWSLRRKVLGWAVFFVACGGLGYCYLLLLGPPGWAPHAVASLLMRLPGV